MNPIYFGSSQRRLFGIYESARSPSRAAGAVLFCHAWGSEYTNSYRAISYAARRFAAAGFSTLRFDYFGTGDSEGESHEADLSSWEGDIETALEELREMAQTKNVALFGLRLGATLAARVAQRGGQAVKRLALWDPIVVGSNYVDAVVAGKHRQRRAVGSAPPRNLAPEAIYELDGMRVSSGFVAGLRAIEMDRAAASLPPGTVVVNTHASARPTEERSKEQPLLSCAGSVALSSLLPAPWASASETASALPVATVDQIIERWR